MIFSFFHHTFFVKLIEINLISFINVFNLKNLYMNWVIVYFFILLFHL